MTARALGAHLFFVPALLLLTACGGSPSASSQAPDGDVEGTVTVLAASSLTDAFEAVADAFETDHPGSEVDLSFDGSSALATAIVEGGVPADVFASADRDNLEKVQAAGLAQGGPITFATSSLQIVVATGNPLGIRGLADLARVKLALCGPEVPCGRYAGLAFRRAGLPIPRAGDQRNVKGVITQVQLGEADAGLVYATDVLAAEGVEGVDLAPDEQVEATYPAIVLDDAPNPAGAVDLLQLLRSPEGQRILREHGFGTP